MGTGYPGHYWDHNMDTLDQDFCEDHMLTRFKLACEVAAYKFMDFGEYKIARKIFEITEQNQFPSREVANQLISDLSKSYTPLNQAFIAVLSATLNFLDSIDACECIVSNS